VFEIFFVSLKARKLEAQLDDQMNTYRKLVSVKSNGSENHIESDIERSLKQLQQVNSQMQTWVSSGGSEVLLSHLDSSYGDFAGSFTGYCFLLRLFSVVFILIRLRPAYPDLFSSQISLKR
jgi:Golgi SNAP receptor complex protein 1